MKVFQSFLSKVLIIIIIIVYFAPRKFEGAYS